MKILVSGASGLMGRTLVSAWRSQGHQVLTLVRDPKKLEKPNTVLWEPPHKGPDLSVIEGLDVMVHLSGEPIAGHRWTPARKAAIRASRIDTTQLLAQTFARLKSPPKVWLCASAIGYYGNRGDMRLTEDSTPGQGFLAEVCKAWEAAAQSVALPATRIVHLRNGIVLSLQGGALVSLKRLFQWGVGGPLGSGLQFMSWITLEDVCGIIRYVIRNENISGAINVVTPNPVTNEEFSTELARVLHRPHFFHLPQRVAHAALGHMADELLFSSQRVKPAILQDANYRYLFPDLRGALEHLIRPA